MNLHLLSKYIKRNNELNWTSSAMQTQFERFIKSIPEGHIVEAYFEVTHDDGTLAQLAKLHAMIRSLAGHIGETVENLKLIVKDRAGLCILREAAGKEYFLAKSFGDCSKEELSLAIQAAIEIGDSVNYPLN